MVWMIKGKPGACLKQVFVSGSLLFVEADTKCCHQMSSNQTITITKLSIRSELLAFGILTVHIPSFANLITTTVHSPN